MLRHFNQTLKKEGNFHLLFHVEGKFSLGWLKCYKPLPKSNCLRPYKASKVPSVATLHVLSAFDVQMFGGWSAHDLDRTRMKSSRKVWSHQKKYYLYNTTNVVFQTKEKRCVVLKYTTVSFPLNIWKHLKVQECIPVGCVPSATVAVCWGGVSSPGGCLLPEGCLFLGGCLFGGGGWYPCTEADSPHVDRQTGVKTFATSLRTVIKKFTFSVF